MIGVKSGPREPQIGCLLEMALVLRRFPFLLALEPSVQVSLAPESSSPPVESFASKIGGFEDDLSLCLGPLAHSLSAAKLIMGATSVKLLLRWSLSRARLLGCETRA